MLYFRHRQEIEREREREREMDAVLLLPMQATRTIFCLVIVVVIGSILVHHADAQSSDDCVNWLDVRKSHPLPCMIVIFADL